MQCESAALAAHVYAVREQQRRLANAETVLQMSYAIDLASDADRAEVFATLRAWREWFATEVATLPLDDQVRERRFLAAVESALAESAASGA